MRTRVWLSTVTSENNRWEIIRTRSTRSSSYGAASSNSGTSATSPESTESLDRVLDIFIRVNSQGQPLSKSDLLMSIATAQWQIKDARDEIPATLRRVNGIHPGFGFDRDHVLKAGLVLAGISDVGFRARPSTSRTCRRLENEWDAISQTLYRTVELLASFGLSRDNIDAGMVLIPVAHYLHRRSLGDSYLSSQV